jgi:hypothetical protein
MVLCETPYNSHIRNGLQLYSIYQIQRLLLNQLKSDGYDSKMKYFKISNNQNNLVWMILDELAS